MRYAGSTLLLIVCVLTSPSASAQNGLEFLNQGAKGAGRAGASTAMADDSLSAARNPALLTQIGGTRLDGALIFRNERIRRRNLTDDVLDENLGVWPLPFLGFSTDLTSDEDLDDLDAAGPYVGFGLFQPMMGVVAPTGTLALELTDTLSFGISVNVLLSTLSMKSGGANKGGGSSPVRDFRPAGKVFLHYQPDGTPVVPPQAFDPGSGRQLTWADVFDVGFQAAAPTGASSSGTSTSSGEKIEIDYELNALFGAGIAAQLGFLWTPREDLSLAFSVRTPGIIFEPSGSGSIDLTQAVDVLTNNAAVGLLISSLRDTTLPNQGQNGFEGDYDIELDDIIIPASVSLGVAWWPLPRWVLTLDLRWIGWSHSLDEITIRATGGDNADLNEIAGGRTVEYTLPLDWRDQFVVAIGTTVAVNDWLLLRAGYNHGENPIPANGLFSNSSVIEDHLTCGVGLRFGNWDVDLAYAWGLPKRVDMPGASFKVELHQLFLGVGYEF